MRQPVSRQIGEYCVTVLSDGKMSASLELLLGMNTAAAGKIQQHAGITEPGSIHINCYLIQTQSKTILVDTGTGGRNNVGGELQQSLLAAGVTPDEIDVVLLTHAHPDHIGGMLDAEERRVFPNAQIYLHPLEARYWLDDEKLHQATERAQRNFALARRVLNVYESSLHFLKTDALIEGIRPVALPGHTPGHTGFRIDAADQPLLIWGDIVHFPHIQSAYPSVSIAFDCDPVQARATREQTLHQAVNERLLIAGMHLGIEGFAAVSPTAEGYQLVDVDE